MDGQIKQSPIRRNLPFSSFAGLVLVFMAVPVFGQTLTTLFSFAARPKNLSSHSALVEGADGSFYGTSYAGGTDDRGTIFKVTPAGAVTTLFSFRDDIFPDGLALGSDGNFYGTTELGGDEFSGTVYRMTPGGEVTTLVSFVRAVNGAEPVGALLPGSDGNLYGTTFFGGGSDEGTVFRMTTNGVLTTLAVFNGTNGGIPASTLIMGRDGNFYGTTTEGGAGNSGTVFKMTPAGVLTTLASFYRTNGAVPNGLVQGKDGNFYGTTLGGGTNNLGTVFKLTPDGTLTTLATFNGNNGSSPWAGLVEGADGNFYGTTETGGPSNYGSVFQITPDGTLTTLVWFNESNGMLPLSTLAKGSNGKLYGTTFGATACNGTVFQVTTNGAFSTVAFLTGDVGSGLGGLVQGDDGNFYGTTGSAGTPGLGAIFKMTPEGEWTKLAMFDGTNGSEPLSTLIQGRDGSFYGVASGGVSNYGTVFKMTTGGVLTALVSFNSPNGADLRADLVQGDDGMLYGTTAGGGANGSGTVFRVTTNGTFTSLVSFDGSNGARPEGPLVQGSNGNFYGSTWAGGAADGGTVFQVTTNGVLTTLVSFNADTGVHPNGPLTQGRDGNFYGTTYGQGGTSDRGTLFRMTPAGLLTRMVAFGGTNDEFSFPATEVIQGSDGNFYGTTRFNYGESGGTIFKVTPAGVLTVLVSFVGTNGANPYYRMVQGRDGNFYGTTLHGSTNNDGIIFRLVFKPPVMVTSPVTTLSLPGSSVTLTTAATGDHLSYQWRRQGVDIRGATDASLVLLNVTAGSAGDYSVVVSNLAGAVTSEAGTLLLPAASYSGLFYETNGVTEPSSGYFTLTLANSLKFTGRIYVDGFDYPLTGQFSAADFSAHTNVVRLNQPGNLSVDLQLVSTNGSVQITGTVSDGVWTAALLGDRAYYATAHFCPQAGNYALTLFGSGDGGNRPNYGSRGVVNVAMNGTITFHGTLGDDSVLAQATGISRDGQWPLYVPLYVRSTTTTHRLVRTTVTRYTGSLLGWITFTNQTDSRLQGNVSWVKTAAFGKYYSAGFTNTMAAFGSVRQ